LNQILVKTRLGRHIFGLFQAVIPNFVFACTIGAFSNLSTQSQLPMLWKNRDVSNPNQAVFFFAQGKYRYLGLVYADDSTQVWAGINEKGFAIINSNSANIGPGANSGPSDGEIMKYALQNCASIEDFQHFLDSTNLVGRKTPANFGVIDSTGEATIFEAGAYQYQRFDATKESLGFLLRANYSMSGDSTQRSGHPRYLRAMQLAQIGQSQGILNAQYIIQKIARDLGGPDFDPYPLPFCDTFGSYPFGFLPTTATINRYRTRACVLIVGQPKMPMMWTILGEPCIGIAIPLFLNAFAVPPQISGPGLPKICAQAKTMRELVYMGTDLGINTFLLAAIQKQTLPLENQIFSLSQAQLEDWLNHLPGSLAVLSFEESLAQRVCEVYENIGWGEEKSFPIFHSNILVAPILTTTTNGLKIIIREKITNENLPIRFKVYNIFGQKKAEITLPAQTQSYFWLPEKLSSGTYFLILEPNHQIVAKFHYLSENRD